MSGSVAPEARMGNDIARQFAHLPTEVAAQAVARHIETFWDPRMRRALEALVAAHDDSLDPLLVDAVGRLAKHAARSDARSPALGTSPRRRPGSGPGVRHARDHGRAQRRRRRHLGSGAPRRHREPEPNRLGYGNNQIHVVQLDLVAAAP